MALFDAKLEASILKVEDEIEKVNLNVDVVENTLKGIDSINSSELQYWRKEKEQLRTKEAQLRTKEAQLRTEKELLLKQRLELSSSTGPTVLHPKERVRNLLLQLLPPVEANDQVLTRCVENSWLAARLNCVSNKFEALRLYEEAEAIPQSETRAIAAEQGVMIDGPLQFAGPQTATFFRAFENTKHAQVLKVNHNASKSEKECQLYVALKNDAEHSRIALVPVRLLHLDKSSKHQNARSSPARPMSPFLGLLMPYYAYSFGDLPVPITCTYALEVFRRIVVAIDFIHDRGWMHGDVKPGNIFCGWDGEAWLGDYGSSVSYEALQTFTGGTLKYQCDDVPHVIMPRLFDGVGLALSLLERLGALDSRGRRALLLNDILALVRDLSGADASELIEAIFTWIQIAQAQIAGQASVPGPLSSHPV